MCMDMRARVCVCVYNRRNRSFKKMRDKPAACFLYEAKKATVTEKKIMDGLRLTVSLRDVVKSKWHEQTNELYLLAGGV